MNEAPELDLPISIHTSEPTPPGPESHITTPSHQLPPTELALDVLDKASPEVSDREYRRSKRSVSDMAPYTNTDFSTHIKHSTDQNNISNQVSLSQHGAETSLFGPATAVTVAALTAQPQSAPQSAKAEIKPTIPVIKKSVSQPGFVWSWSWGSLPVRSTTDLTAVAASSAVTTEARPQPPDQLVTEDSLVVVGTSDAPSVVLSIGADLALLTSSDDCMGLPPLINLGQISYDSESEGFLAISPHSSQRDLHTSPTPTPGISNEPPSKSSAQHAPNCMFSLCGHILDGRVDAPEPCPLNTAELRRILESYSIPSSSLTSASITDTSLVAHIGDYLVPVTTVLALLTHLAPPSVALASPSDEETLGLLQSTDSVIEAITSTFMSDTARWLRSFEDMFTLIAPSWRGARVSLWSSYHSMVDAVDTGDYFDHTHYDTDHHTSYIPDQSYPVSPSKAPRSVHPFTSDPSSNTLPESMHRLLSDCEPNSDTWDVAPVPFTQSMANLDMSYNLYRVPSMLQTPYESYGTGYGHWDTNSPRYPTGSARHDSQHSLAGFSGSGSDFRSFGPASVGMDRRSRASITDLSCGYGLYEETHDGSTATEQRVLPTVVTSTSTEVCTSVRVNMPSSAPSSSDMATDMLDLTLTHNNSSADRGNSTSSNAGSLTQAGYGAISEEHLSLEDITYEVCIPFI